MFVKYMKYWHEDVIFTANGIFLSYKQCGIAALEGYSVGIPDISIFESRGKYHGAFIEFKSEKGKIKECQKEMIQRLKKKKYAVTTCFDVLSAIDFIEKYLAL